MIASPSTRPRARIGGLPPPSKAALPAMTSTAEPCCTSRRCWTNRLACAGCGGRCAGGEFSRSGQITETVEQVKRSVRAGLGVNVIFTVPQAAELRHNTNHVRGEPDSILWRDDPWIWPCGQAVLCSINGTQRASDCYLLGGLRGTLLAMK